jgi:hypothetical protein
LTYHGISVRSMLDHRPSVALLSISSVNTQAAYSAAVVVSSWPKGG